MSAFFFEREGLSSNAAKNQRCNIMRGWPHQPQTNTKKHPHDWLKQSCENRNQLPKPATMWSDWKISKLFCQNLFQRFGIKANKKMARKKRTPIFFLVGSRRTLFFLGLCFFWLLGRAVLRAPWLPLKRPLRVPIESLATGRKVWTTKPFFRRLKISRRLSPQMF